MLILKLRKLACLVRSLSVSTLLKKQAYYEPEAYQTKRQCQPHPNDRHSGKEIKKLLIKGKATLSYEAAEVLRTSSIELFGNESQTVGPEDAPAAVHRLLLGAGKVFLEGIRLAAVPEGIYLLNAAPIHLGGSDGAPCRAVLLEL